MDPHRLAHGALSDRELYDLVTRDACDRATWEAFVARFSKLCYHAIHRVLARHTFTTPGDADELFQSLFEQLLMNDCAALKRFRGDNGCSPATYLSHMAAFQALEWVRAQDRRRRQQVSSDVDGDAVSRVAAPGLSAVEELERQEVVAQVQGALAGLSPSDQLLYQLHYARGMSLIDVARFLSRSESAIHVQHYRLKERLRKALTADREASQALG